MWHHRPESEYNHPDSPFSSPSSFTSCSIRWSSVVRCTKLSHRIQITYNASGEGASFHPLKLSICYEQRCKDMMQREPWQWPYFVFWWKYVIGILHVNLWKMTEYLNLSAFPVYTCQTTIELFTAIIGMEGLVWAGVEHASSVSTQCALLSELPDWRQVSCNLRELCMSLL